MSMRVRLCGVFLLGAGCATAQNAWLKQAAAEVLTPSSDRVAPVTVVRTEGRVDAADALLLEDGKSCRLTFEKGGKKPVAVLDFGKQSVGGYAVFTVTAKTGQPVVRLAYACHPDGLSETGCFTRETSARYLGPAFDLPVLPGNVNRHECYTVPRTGRFIAPLIQGQARYVRVQLDTEATSVDIDSVVMVNSQVYDRSSQDGAFLCSDERLNRLWAISTWTLQIASFPNHDAWKTVDGWLLPRKLEQADDLGLSVTGEAWGDVTIETCFELRSNPHHVSAAGVAFRAKDTRNAYLAQVSLDGAFQLLRRVDGKDAVLSEKRLVAPLTDGQQVTLEITARGPALITRLDGVVIDETTDPTFAAGRVGFYTPKETWPLYDHIRVTDSKGQVLLADDFSGALSKWQFARTLSFVADGAKRDRLVWSGDLYWAERTVFYSFAKPTYLRDSLKMLAFNQTPEGYVHASPYPERSVPPPSGDYGPFPSDEFAAWLVPVAWDYLLYTDDVETLRGIYASITRLLGYLQSHIGEKGLFVQRAETSKHAGDLKSGDVRARTYMNVLLWGVFADAARIATRLDRTEESAAYQRQSDALKRAIFECLWDEPNGCFREALETPGFGPEANALALSMGLVTQEQALRIAPQFKKIGHGKFQSLASRGKFEYGFSQSALQALFDHNWTKLLDVGWKGAATTTECMGMMTRGWGDESHPDTAIAAHFSAYILGVRPTEPGFRRFTVQPQPVKEVTWAKGVVPTPHGPIVAGWEVSGNTLKLSLTVPQGTRADAVLPKSARLLVNGKPGEGRNLAAGVYVIEACDLAPDALKDPTTAVATAATHQPCSLKASSSHEAGGWALAGLLAPALDTAKKGYCSKAHPSPESTEWIEIDLGEEATLAQLVLVPRADMKTADNQVAGFPRDFTVQLAKEPGKFTTVKALTGCPAPDASGLTLELYTVISYPVARYIRLTATRLGEPARDDPGNFRLQLSRLRVVRPEELRAKP
jgi:alpha-L-rhamnosidase